MTNATELYLELLKKSLTFYLWGESLVPVDLEEIIPLKNRWLIEKISHIVKNRGVIISKKFDYNPKEREYGVDWPPQADTMIGLKRLDNLQMCIESVIHEDVHGDLIETGVWRGGGSIFMRGVLKAYDVVDRKVYAADSFMGLPPPDPEKYPEDKGDLHHQIDYLRVSLEEVKANFKKYNLLDDQVVFLKGWFKETLPRAPIDHLAVVRLDGDMYESTMDALACLYPKLSIGGYLIVDDYVLDNCRAAVHDFRKFNRITEAIQDIDGTGAYWRREQ